MFTACGAILSSSQPKNKSYPSSLVHAYPADIRTEYRGRSHLAVCGFHIRGLGLIQTEEILSVGGELPDLRKVFGLCVYVSMFACL